MGGKFVKIENKNSRIELAMVTAVTIFFVALFLNAGKNTVSVASLPKAAQSSIQTADLTSPELDLPASTSSSSVQDQPIYSNNSTAASSLTQADNANAFWQDTSHLTGLGTETQTGSALAAGGGTGSSSGTSGLSGGGGSSGGGGGIGGGSGGDGSGSAGSGETPSNGEDQNPNPSGDKTGTDPVSGQTTDTGSTDTPTGQNLFPASTGKICGGFMDNNDIERLQPMAENGLNTAIVAYWLMHSPPETKEQELVATWAQSCRNFNLGFMALFSLWGNGEKTWAKPTYYLTFGGKEYANTPCPLASYKTLVHDRFVALAQLSKTVPITGAVLDIEMYGADMINYDNLCFCDYCYGLFQKAHPSIDIVPKKNREQYLTDIGQMDNYKQFIDSQLTEMAHQTEKEVHQIAALFKIGATRLDNPNYYNESLAKGLGTEENPVLVFCERTYWVGYHPTIIKETIERFKTMGASASLIAGIWQDKWPTADLADIYYNCYMACDGYWIYSMETLNPSAKSVFVGTESSKKYWQAIFDANKRLELNE
jgi:hypothetical protein